MANWHLRTIFLSTETGPMHVHHMSVTGAPSNGEQKHNWQPYIRCPLLAVPGHCWWCPCAWCGRGAPGNHCWGARPGAWSSSHRSACRPAACQPCTQVAARWPVEGRGGHYHYEEVRTWTCLTSITPVTWNHFDFSMQHSCFYAFAETVRLDTAHFIVCFVLQSLLLQKLNIQIICITCCSCCKHSGKRFPAIVYNSWWTRHIVALATSKITVVFNENASDYYL